MLHKIKVRDNTRAADILFFHEIDLDVLPNPRIVPLFGANGAGKTTLLKAIEETPTQLKEIEYFLKKQRGEDADACSLADAMRELDTEQSKWEWQFWEDEIQNAQSKLSLDMCRDDMPEIIFKYRNSDDNFRTREAKSMSEDFNPVFIKSRWDAQSLSEGQSIMYSSLMLFDALQPGSEELLKKGKHAIVLVDEIDSGLSLDNLDMVLKKIKKIVEKRDDVQVFLSFNTSYVLKYFPDVISLYDGKVHHIANEDEMLAELKKNKTMLNKARKTSRGKYKIFS